MNRHHARSGNAPELRHVLACRGPRRARHARPPSARCVLPLRRLDLQPESPGCEPSATGRLRSGSASATLRQDTTNRPQRPPTHVAEGGPRAGLRIGVDEPPATAPAGCRRGRSTSPPRELRVLPGHPSHRQQPTAHRGQRRASPLLDLRATRHCPCRDRARAAPMRPLLVPWRQASWRGCGGGVRAARSRLSV